MSSKLTDSKERDAALKRFMPEQAERKTTTSEPGGEVTGGQPGKTDSWNINDMAATINAPQPESSIDNIDSMQTRPMAQSEPIEQPEDGRFDGDTKQAKPMEPTATTQQTAQAPPKRPTGRQRKESLEEYRQTFLCVPKLEDRKPVFVSREVRDRLDEIARKLGDRRTSVSGFIENLARHHLAAYHEEIEVWRKL